MVECRQTARAVGYAVPCPTRLLPGMTPFGGDPNGGPRCQIHYIGLALCDRRWKRWVVGSSAVGNEHLVITASPRPEPDYARLINGPAWYPGAAEQLDGWVTIQGWRARWVTVPAATNDGSVHGPYRSGLDRGTTYLRRRLPRRVTQHSGVGPAAPPVDPAHPPLRRETQPSSNSVLGPAPRFG